MNIQIWSDNEIKSRAKKIMDFLQLTHPFLESGSSQRVCMELRPLYRPEKKFIRSTSMWQVKRSLRQLEEFLAMINGEPFDAYFSVFCLDYDKSTYTEEGKSYTRGYINNQNARFTQIIPMDFDGITMEEYQQQVNRLATLGIEVISVFSGHGYQSHIMLDKPCSNKSLLKDMTGLLRQKGFPVDLAISDAARVMRLPYTNNCKAFDPHNKYHTTDPQAVPTDLITTTDKRYSLDFIMNALQSLPDNSIQAVEGKLKKHRKLKEKIETPKKQTNSVVNQYKFTNAESDYQEIIKWDALPIHIQRMLSQTKNGFRNSVLMYLIPYLRNSLKLDLNQIKTVMAKWALRCVPALDEVFVQAEVERIYAYGAKGLWGSYTEDMEKEFGHPMAADRFFRQNKILVQNRFFESYSELSDTAVKIYLAMKIEERTRDKDYWTVDEICAAANISKNSVQRNLLDLIQNKFVDKKRSDRKTGKKYQYYLNQYPCQYKGFTLFERGTLKDMLSSLTGGELKLYTYIESMIGASPNRECTASQAYLAERIGKKQCSISQMTDSLHEKRYIKKRTRLIGFISYCEYILFF
ncbi:hypothetical protein [Paenibacillus marinisediminis]